LSATLTAALALEAARQLGSRVKSLVLVEPVSFHLLQQEDRPEWAEIEQLGKAVLGAVAKGDDRTAAAAFMSYWLGRWRWRLSPERFKAAIAATIPKVALEFGIIIDAPTTLKEYAEIATPALFIKGGQDARADPRRGRSPGRDLAECQGRDARGRRAYEPVHPSF
jgi:pimeloyl-ACP methyl ester carboxylesterase